MRLRFAPTLAPVLTAVLGHATLEGATEGRTIALFPTQNRAGDRVAAQVLDRTLRLELGAWGRTIDAEATRNAVRRLRIRNCDRAVPGLLRLLGEELGADWLVSATLHDAGRRLVPQLTVSVRLYSSATGQLIWAGFEGGSGLDRRKLLGFGVIHELEGLVTPVVRALLEDLPASPDAAGGEPTRDARDSGNGLGTLAIVPFAGSTARRITVNAETVTEAARARLLQSGTRLVSPNESFEILRRLQAGQWGGVTTETRAALRDASGADHILTGAVEAYDVGGSENEPEPRVAVAMRLVDGATGRILWTGAEERAGRGGLNLLGLGRIHSCGALTERIVEDLTDRLRQEGIQIGRPLEGER